MSEPLESAVIESGRIDRLPSVWLELSVLAILSAGIALAIVWFMN